MDKLKQAIIGNRPFYYLSAVACLLLIGGFLCPPLAVIDGSVLKGVGEIIGMMALWTVIVALRTGRSTRIRHNNTEVTIGKEGESIN